MKQARNCFWCGLTTINLLLASCPIILFRRAKSTEEHLIAVLVLIGCFFLLAVVDAVGIVIADGMAEITQGGVHHERAESEQVSWVCHILFSCRCLQKRSYMEDPILMVF